MSEEQIDASDLWVALAKLPRPDKLIPFPRNMPGTEQPVGELRMWPLTQEEQMSCNGEADKFTKKLLKDPQQKDQANLGYHHTYANETAVQVLFRACRNATDVKRPAFPSPTLLRNALTTDEIGVLFAQYTTLQSELGPIVAYMSTEEQDALIARLQMGGSAFPFDSLSWEQQRILLLGMASRLVSCWTAMSSAGLPLDVSEIVLQALGIQSLPPSQESPPSEIPPSTPSETGSLPDESSEPDPE